MKIDALYRYTRPTINGKTHKIFKIINMVNENGIN